MLKKSLLDKLLAASPYYSLFLELDCGHGRGVVCGAMVCTWSHAFIIY